MSRMPLDPYGLLAYLMRRNQKAKDICRPFGKGKDHSWRASPAASRKRGRASMRKAARRSKARR